MQNFQKYLSLKYFLGQFKFWANGDPALRKTYTGWPLKHRRAWKSRDLSIFKMVVIWGMLFFTRDTEKKRSINYISK